MSSRCGDNGRADRRLPVAVLAIAAMCAGIGTHSSAEHPIVRRSAALTVPPSATRPARPPARLPTLRVCADPNNLPFSNRARSGFENRIAELVAGELHRSLHYTWWSQRRGFVRNTLDARRCDLVMGMPSTADRILATAPYYTSTYVFLSRRAAGRPITSLDDPRLRRLRVGLHFIGDDYHNTPAATALARRGIVRNVVGYSIYGDYSKPNPPAALVYAVARGDVDVAIVWGPFAGYFGPRSGVPLVSTPVTPAIDGPRAAFVFPISAGVRRGDTALRAAVDRAMDAERPAIRAVLARYGVPIVEAARVPGGSRRSLASLGMTRASLGMTRASGLGCAVGDMSRGIHSCE
jgi:mxaJ protein